MFYGPELARIHDAGFGALARAAVATTVAMLAEAGIRDGLVVDLGCGTGIGAQALLEAGYDVLGVDISSDQLAVARERAPDARFEQASLYDFEPPPCVAITIAGEGLSYAADERAGPSAARAVFERAYAAIAPGGLLLFDVVTPGREGVEPRRSWYEGEGWLICVESWEEPGRCLLHRRMATFSARPDGSWRRADEHHTQHALDPAAVVADLRAAGFEARVLSGYGDAFPFRRGHAGFAATKR